ncbi:MAG: hypothetical protein L6R40_008403, partial [Gallowayella cf. fulva]
IFYLSQSFYKATLNLTKISILHLYLRIFTNILWFRRLTLAIAAYIALYALATILATIFQCAPVKRAWDREVEGKCIDLTRFWYANAVHNVVSDVLVLALPVPVIRRLQMPGGVKGGLYGVFSLGVV